MSADATTYIEALASRFIKNGLHFSIHRKLLYEGDNEGIAFPGQAFTKVEDAVRSAKYWASKGHDVYMAMGGEREIAKEDKPRRFPKALRKRHNVGACSAIYLDIDVKADAYATHKDALDALKRFLVHCKLPIPSLMVSSGTGGIHTYWITEELFSPVEHEAFSTSLINMANEFGLKFDQECTKDLCRLLRVPDTWNFKQSPALPVKLLYSGSKVALAVLRERLKVNNVVRLPITPPAAADENDDLMRQKKEYPPADINLVATFCAFIHNTLMSGGRDHKEAIWKQTVSLASYCEDGRNVAHQLSKSHPAYTPEETDVKFDQVEIDRKNNPRLGPAHCSAIRQLGVSECDTCIYYQLNTTPLNVPLYNATPKVVPSHNPNSDLPASYYRDKDSTIWTDVTDTSSGNTSAYNVFPYSIIYNSAFAEGGIKEYNFVFTTLEGNGHPKVVKLPMAASANKDGLMAALAKNGLPMVVGEATRKFMVAFQSILRSHDDTLVTTNPIGWHTMPDGSVGFAYNGNCYLQSKVIKAQRLDPELARAYSVTGDEKYWRELSELVIAQNRPDINLIIACGFGAPLMALTGHSGIAIGAWSSKSGLGKSTALSLCQAIWGSTSRMQGLDDTVNQVMDTMATLKNMPLCWDEIRGSQQTEQMSRLIFSITRGREKGRLTRNATQAQQRDFESLLIWTANNPLMDEIARATRGTIAGNYRIFEFNVDETFVSSLNVGHMSDLTGELRKNYGHIGQHYAEWLGRNYARVRDLITKMRDKIDDDLITNQSERYWSAAAACIIVGARLANGLRFAKFDLAGLEQFIYAKIKQFRISASNTSDFSSIASVELMLGEFFQSMALNTLKTDTMLTGRGRPTKGAIKVLNDNIVFTRQTVQVQISQKELLCRISDPALSEWAKTQKIPKSALTTALNLHFKAVSMRGRIGSGTDYVSPPLLVWELDLSKTNLGQEFEF